MKKAVFCGCCLLLVGMLLNLFNLIIATKDLVNNAIEPIESTILLIDDPSKVSDFDYDFHEHKNRMLSSSVDFFSEVISIALKVRLSGTKIPELRVPTQFRHYSDNVLE